MTGPRLLARIDQHRASTDAIIDMAVDTLREILATKVDDPGVAAVQLAISLHAGIDPRELADTLAFALLRLAEAGDQ